MTEIERLILENQYAIMRILRSDYMRWYNGADEIDGLRKRIEEFGINKQCKKTTEALGERIS